MNPGRGRGVHAVMNSFWGSVINMWDGFVIVSVCPYPLSLYFFLPPSESDIVLLCLCVYACVWTYTLNHDLWGPAFVCVVIACANTS